MQDIERRIIGVSAKGKNTLIMIAKRPEDTVKPDPDGAGASGYVQGLNAEFWVQDVSADGRIVHALVYGVEPERFYGQYNTAVLNATHLPRPPAPKVLDKDTSARIIQNSIVPANPDSVGDEATTTRIMIGMGIDFGGHVGMHGRVVHDNGKDVPGGSFTIDEAQGRVAFANVSLRPDDLKGCHVILTPVAAGAQAKPADPHAGGHASATEHAGGPH